jgi:hypothetical protein
MVMRLVILAQLINKTIFEISINIFELKNPLYALDGEGCIPSII